MILLVYVNCPRWKTVCLSPNQILRVFICAECIIRLGYIYAPFDMSTIKDILITTSLIEELMELKRKVLDEELMIQIKDLEGSVKLPMILQELNKSN